MTTLRLFLIAFLLACGQAHAQGAATSEEISFWESVRDSKNPAELQAYLDQYPSGRFAVLARARLAALGQKPPAQPAQASPPPVAPVPLREMTSETRMPQVGDTWTYRLSYPRLRGQWGQPTRAPATHVVKVGAVGDGQIVDQMSVDGGTPGETTHSREAYLVPQGVSIFSPYLVAFRDLPARLSLGTVAIRDPACGGRYACDASARVVGYEPVATPAGTFSAVKVLVSHSWRSSGSGSGAAAVSGMMGGRNLTVWYVPELKRAAKMQSRITVGDLPPVESTFDLELVSYQVK